MVYPTTDLAFSKNGDLVLEGGDLKDTSWDLWESLRQEIRTRICGVYGDWKLYPSLVADLIELLGSPNTRETGKKIETKSSYSLISDGFLTINDFSLRVVPISLESVAVIVTVSGYNPENKETEEVSILFTSTNTEMNPGIISAN